MQAQTSLKSSVRNRGGVVQTLTRGRGKANRQCARIACGSNPGAEGPGTLEPVPAIHPRSRGAVNEHVGDARIVEQLLELRAKPAGDRA